MKSPQTAEETQTQDERIIWVFNLEIPGLNKFFFMTLNKLFSKKQRECHAIYMSH